MPHSNSSRKPNTSSPLHAYHSNVMRAMCTQMVYHSSSSHQDRPLPLAKRPTSSSPYSSASSSRSSSVSSVSSSGRTSPITSQQDLTQHVQEEMARRVKADRVLQDLSSDKSRQLARARETARRNKWATSIASVCSPEEVGGLKREMAMYQGKQGVRVGVM